MAEKNKNNPFVRLSNNLLILDCNLQIVNIGDTIREKLFSDQEIVPDFLNNFPDPQEKKQISDNLNELINDKDSKPLKMRHQNYFGVYQSGYPDGSIVIFQEERQRKIRDEDLKNMSKILKERVKELSCLYSFSHVIDKADTIEEVIRGALIPIKEGFQFPEIVNVRFELDKKTYILKDESKINNYIFAEIFVNKIKRGRLTVSYDKKEEFLEEEKRLLDEISASFSKTIERVEAREYLEKQKKILTRKNKKLLELTEECSRGRKKLEALLKAMEGELIVVDRDHNIILSNRNGLKKNDKCYKALFDRNEECHNCPLVNVFEENKSFSIEEKYEKSIYELQFYPIHNDRNEVVNVLEICNDVTKEKNMEFQLIQSYKLASLGKLVAGIAHEINNPNTFIRGNIKIVKEALDDIFPVLEQEYKKNEKLRIARLDYDVFKENIPILLEDMVEGSERIKKIVYGLRNYARKDEGELNDKVVLNNILESSLRLVKNQIQKVAVVKKVLSEDIPVFRGNIQKLEQVIVNLLVNASQAIDKESKGIIKIKTEYSKSLDEVIFTVTDNGIGMDEKTRKSIFDPFFTTKRAKGGTGLGLSISYGIIKEHNGKVIVTTKKGEGTTFTINLPRGKNG